MSTSDLRRALGFGLGGRKLDVLFLDACLMGMIEIAYEFREQCRYLVAGESLLWAQLPYDIYLEAGNLNSNTSPAELADSIVRKYNSAPRRVQKSWAIAAIKLALIDELQARVEQLAGKLSDWLADDADRAAQAIVMAYSECQQFDDNADFRMEAREGYVDLIDFAAKLARRMKDSRQSGNQANLDVTASIIDGITNSLDKGGIVPPRTTSQGDQAEPAGAGERQGARGSDNQRRIDPDKPIFAVLAQTDENPPITEEQIIDLNHAKGLSIYLPIGDMIDSIDHVSLRDKLNASLEQYKSDLNGPALAQLLSDMVDAIENAPDKDNDISAREALDLHLARYSGQLLFTQATPSWVKLLEQLRTVLETMGKSQPDNLRNLLARSDSVRVFNRPRQRT